MPRKKNNRAKSKPSDLANLEASAKKLQSYLTHPDLWGYMRSGTMGGIREKILKIDYNTVRNVVDRVPLINAVISARIGQVKKFSRFIMEKGETTGYEFIMADPFIKATKKDEKVFWQLSQFLDQTGLLYDSKREDDFHDYLEMLTRETLVIDQVATEIQRNRKGEVIAFWILDGATIKRIDDPKKFKQSYASAGFTVTDKHRFCQIVDDKVSNIYTDEDLLFDYKNKRADLRWRGFGYSPVEQAIDLVTTLLFGYNYLRDQLMRDRVPKGFIQVMGDVGRVQLDGIREYWYAAMSGAGGVWNIPILPSGKDGVGLDWKNIQVSNRDMEYHKLMMFLSSIIAAVFEMDLAEIGIKADDSTALIGESGEPRIKASKDRGLNSLLSFIEQHINKIIRKINENYKFSFVGIEREDETKVATLRKMAVETYRTINELRKEDGLDELKDDYANVVLNPQAVQVYGQSKMKEQMGGGGGSPFGGGAPGEGGEGGEESPPPEGVEQKGEEEGGGEGANVDWGKMFEKSLTSRNKTMRVIIE